MSALRPATPTQPTAPDDASRPYDAFLSYSRADQPFARALHAALVERGKRVWADWRDIPPSAPWPQEIDQAIERADAFVFVLSPDSVKSGHCRRELDHAVRQGKRLVPLVHRSVDTDGVPPPLIEPQWIRADASGALDETVSTLIDALETDLEWRRTHTRLLLRALEWDKADEDSSLVLRGSDLRRAQAELESARGKSPEPTPLQARYVLASTRAASRSRNVRLAIGGLAFIVVAGLAIVALLQRNEAREQTRIAVSRLLAAQSEDQMRSRADYGLALAVAALRVHPTVEARRNLIEAVQQEPRLRGLFPQHSAPVLAVAFSSDGREVISTSRDGHTRRWSARTGVDGERPLEVGRQSSAALSEDGTVLASAKPDGSVTIWTTTERRRAGRFDAGRPPLEGLSVSPDGRLVAAVDAANRLSLWDRRRRRPVATPDGPFGTPVAFSRDGEILGSGAVLVRVPTADVTQLVPVAAHKYGRAPRVMDVSPDGRRLAVTTAGAPMLTAARYDAPLRSLRGEDVRQPVAMRFSPGGLRLASVDSAGTLQLWNVRTGEADGTPLTGQSGTNASLAWAPGGDLLASGSSDGRIAVWSRNATPRLGKLVTEDPGLDAAFTPDGRTLLTGTPTGQRTGRPPGVIRRWDVAARKWREPLALGTHGAVLRVAVSPEGDRFAVVQEHPEQGVSVQQILVLDSRGRSVDRFGERVQFDGEYVELAFGSDRDSLIAGTSAGRLIRRDLERRDSAASREGNENRCCDSLSIDADGATLLSMGLTDAAAWSLPSLRRRDLLPSGRSFSAVAQSPADDTAALATDDGELVLWDLRTREPLGPPLRPASSERSAASTAALSNPDRPSDYVSGLAFSADGRLLAAVDPRGVGLWDLGSRQELGVLPGQPTGYGQVLAFSPKGRLLSTIDESGELRLWDLDDRGLVAEACAIGNRTLTHGEWESLVGSAGEFEDVCPATSGR